MLSRISWMIGSGVLCLSSLSLSTNSVSAGPTPPPPPAAWTDLRDADAPSTRNPQFPPRSSNNDNNNIPLATVPGPSITNTTDEPASNMERYHINGNLDIIVSPGYPIVPANNSLRALLTRADMDAQVSAVRFGANTSLPGGLKEITEGGLRYEVVAPWHHQSQKFTWAQYLALTQWIYRFELGGGGGGGERGRNIVCAFLLFEMGGERGQRQIARGEVRMVDGVGTAGVGGANGGDGGGGGGGEGVWTGDGNANVLETN